MVVAELSADNLAVKILFVCPFERENSSQHDIEKNSEGPHVYWFTVVIALPDDLRTHVGRCPTEHFEFLQRTNYDTEAEVDELDLPAALLNQNVVQFDIPMDHVDLMEIADRLHHLFEHAAGRHLTDHAVRLLSYILSQRDALDIVCDKVDLLRCVNNVVHGDDAGVREAFQDGNFSLHGFAFHSVAQFVLFIGLYSIFLIVPLVQTHSDLCIRSLPDSSSNLIILKLPILS